MACAVHCAACRGTPEVTAVSAEPCSQDVCGSHSSSWQVSDRETPGDNVSGSMLASLDIATCDADAGSGSQSNSESAGLLDILHAEPLGMDANETPIMETDANQDAFDVAGDEFTIHRADDERWAKWRTRRASRDERRRTKQKWNSEVCFDSQGSLRSDVQRRFSTLSQLSSPSSFGSPSVGSLPPLRSVGRKAPVSPTIDAIAEFFSHRPPDNLGVVFQAYEELSSDCRRSRWT